MLALRGPAPGYRPLLSCRWNPWESMPILAHWFSLLCRISVILFALVPLVYVVDILLFSFLALNENLDLLRSFQNTYCVCPNIFFPPIDFEPTQVVYLGWADIDRLPKYWQESGSFFPLNVWFWNEVEVVDLPTLMLRQNSACQL